MPKNWSLVAVSALVFAVSMILSAPSRAEFFGCKDERGKVLASWTTSSTAPYSRSTRYTHELAAQSIRRPQVTVHPRPGYPGPSAKRYCRSWLAKEYRVSGTVIVPHKQCWWR